MIIRQGSFLGIELGANVSTQVFSLNIGAIILFILMSGLQIFSMKLPNIIRKRHESYKTKQLDDSANKQMNTTMNIMIGMIIFTGFMLPAALAVYWAVGALFAIAQTYVFQSEIVKEKLKSLSDRKKKAKVVK
jgi:membrane protein insertase Oxa1/YidC/SpoIIIJ